MYCNHCGSQNQEEVSFCAKCGSQIGGINPGVSQTSSPSVVSIPAKGKGSAWLLWWQLDQNEINKQVENYDTLGIFKSARGQSLLCLLLSVVITGVFVFTGLVDKSAYIDIFLMTFLGIFSYMGYRWALMGAMILWSFEKVFSALSSFSGNGVSGSSLFLSIVWWAIYMHVFYLAYKVEGERRSKATL